MHKWRMSARVPAPAVTGAAESNGTDESVKAYAVALLAEAREEIDRADKKAQVLLAGAGVAIAVLFGALSTDEWSPSALRASVQWLWWLGAMSAAASVLALGASIYPRTQRERRKKVDHIYYFGDVLNLESTTEVVEALRRSATLDLERLADQVVEIGSIAQRKYRLVQWAMWLFFAAGVCCVAAIMFNRLLK